MPIAASSRHNTSSDLSDAEQTGKQMLRARASVCAALSSAVSMSDYRVSIIFAKARIVSLAVAPII